MRRREFLWGLASAVAWWPKPATAQQPTMPVIGFLNTASAKEMAPRLSAFRKGLNEAGYIEGKNVSIEFHWAEGHYDRLPAMAVDLVGHNVVAIVASGGIAAAQAARAATSTVPIVFTTGTDPVKFGLVSSLNRPGGNITGATLVSSMLVAKRIGLLSELLPNAKSFAVLMKSDNPSHETELNEAQEAARTLGGRAIALRASTENDLNAAFASLEHLRPDAMIVATDASFESKRAQLVALAAYHAIPTIYALREYVVDGGLLSYGASITDLYRQAGVYTGRILRGERPADLPIIQPVKFDFAINLKTAKTLGIDVSTMLLTQADEVIE